MNTDLRYSYSLFGVTSKSKSEVWGWICLKIGVRAMTPHSSFRTLKIKISDWVKSVRKDCEECLECHKWRSHSCQVTWKQVRWAEETKFTLLFRNSRTLLSFPLCLESVFFRNFYTQTMHFHFSLSLAESVKEMSRRQRCTKMTHFCCGLLLVSNLQEQVDLGTWLDTTYVRSGVD